MNIDLLEITHHASLVLVFFLIGYTAIIIEEFIKLNKAAAALLMAIACWTVLFLEPAESVDRHTLIFSLQMYKVSQILFFLMGALTIVETINVHKGFRIITKPLAVRSKRKMLWMCGIIAFFLSSVLDNLTTTVVILSLLKKLVPDRTERLTLGGITVIAANAGGAWTPIGDVATTLLWINGQVSTFATMRDLFLPSFCGLIACLLWFDRKFRGTFPEVTTEEKDNDTPVPGSTLIFLFGVLALIFVPVFKVLTGLPPFMGMMLGLGALWVLTDFLHHKYRDENHFRIIEVLPKVDMSVILFYLGVLLAVNSLESAGLLKNMSVWLNEKISHAEIVPIIIGFASSVVDNVSLTAATIGMYDLKQFPTDSSFWQAVAICAGMGGSILIVGSAAGVALMAIERVDFMWYTKRITIPALLTYLVAIIVYFLISPLTKSLSH